MQKRKLFAILNEDHKLDIIEGSTDDLKEMGLINEEGLYFEEGILIEIKDIVYNKEASELSASISKWRCEMEQLVGMLRLVIKMESGRL